MTAYSSAANSRRGRFAPGGPWDEYIAIMCDWRIRFRALVGTPTTRIKAETGEMVHMRISGNVIEASSFGSRPIAQPLQIANLGGFWLLLRKVLEHAEHNERVEVLSLKPRGDSGTCSSCEKLIWYCVFNSFGSS